MITYLFLFDTFLVDRAPLNSPIQLATVYFGILYRLLHRLKLYTDYRIIIDIYIQMKVFQNINSFHMYL